MNRDISFNKVNKVLLEFINNTKGGGIYILNKEGKIIYANKACEEISQYSVQELLSFDSFVFFVHPDDLSAVHKRFENKLFGKSLSDTYSFRLITKKGLIKWIEVSSMVMYDENEPYIVTMVFDITKLKEKEKVLRKEKLFTAFQNMAEGVITFDENGMIVFVNDTALKILEENNEKKFYNRFINFILKSKNFPIEFIEKIFSIVFSQKKILRMPPNFSIILNNKMKYLQGSLFPLVSKNTSEIEGGVFVFSDTTSLKTMEDKMTQNQKLKVIGNLSRSIAHDFNNYLSSLKSNIDILKRKLENSSELGPYIHNIEMVINESKELALQLLSLPNPKTEIKSKKLIDLRRLLQEIINFSLAGKEQDINVNFYCQEDLWYIRANKSEITQIISNLIINAVQSMETSKVKNLTVEAYNVTFKNDNLPFKDYVKIIVSDTGIGIPEKNLHKIFKADFTTKKNGFGIGLSTVNSLVKSYKGFIEVDSQVKKGTSFFIYLPAESNVRISSIPKEIEHETVNAEKMTKTILLVDDEVHIRNVFSEILKLLGYNSVLASNGKEAVKIYEKFMGLNQKIDLVIIDLNLSDAMSGKETCKSIKKIDPSAKIVITSGMPDHSIMTDYKKYGVISILKKPFSIDDLKNLFDKIFSEK